MDDLPAIAGRWGRFAKIGCKTTETAVSTVPVILEGDIKVYFFVFLV